VRGLVARGGINVGAQLFATLCGYLVALLLARALGPEGFGVYGVVASLLLSVELVARLGIPTAALKLLAEGRPAEQVIPLSALLTLAAALFAFLALWLAAPAIASALGLPGGSALVRLAAFDIPVFAFYFLWVSLAAGQGRFRLRALLVVLYAAARLVGALVVVLFWPSVEGALVAIIAASAVAVAFGLWRLALPRAPPRPTLLKPLAATALPVWLRTLAQNLLPHLSLWLVAALSPGTVLGGYVAALALARAPQALGLGLAPVVLHDLARAQKRGDDPATTVAPGAELLLALLLPACAVLAVEAASVMELLFGAGYREAAPLFAVLAIGFGVGETLFAVASAALVATGRGRIAALWAWSMLGALGAGVLALTPSLGLPGAALASSAAVLAGGVLSLGSLLPLRLWPRVWSRPLTLAAILTGAAVLLPAGSLELLWKLPLLALLWMAAATLLGLARAATVAAPS